MPARKAEPLKKTDKTFLIVLGCRASPVGRISLKAYLASAVLARTSHIIKEGCVQVWFCLASPASRA